MEQAILFHRDTELALIMAQKQIIYRINSNNSAALRPFFPIMCMLQDSFWKGKKIDQIKKQIQKVTFGNFYIEEDGLFTDCRIFVSDNGEIRERVRLATAAAPVVKDSAQLQESANICGISPKVFRIAEIKKQGHITEIWTPVWVKIR